MRGYSKLRVVGYSTLYTTIISHCTRPTNYHCYYYYVLPGIMWQIVRRKIVISFPRAVVVVHVVLSGFAGNTVSGRTITIRRRLNRSKHFPLLKNVKNTV